MINDSLDTHVHSPSNELTLFKMLPNLETADKVTIATHVISTLSVAL